MGIINNDVYVCSNGVQKTGTYISFATETIYVVQSTNGMLPMPSQAMPSSGAPSYSVRANYRVFWDQECREAGKTFIDLKSINATLTVDQLNGNIYSILYAELKTLYSNYADEVVYAASVPSVPEPSAPASSAPPS